MRTIGERIKYRREELNISQEELAKILGYKSRSSINKIETDARNLTQSKIKAIADALQTTPMYIMGWEDINHNELPHPDLRPVELRRLPILGNVACGEPIFAEEDHTYFIEAGANVNADFCLRARGDSMINARIFDGDIVLVKKQPMVENGEIAVVLIGDEATLKKVYYDKENAVLQLVPENPSYPIMRYTGEELNNIRILGKAVGGQYVLK